MPHIGGFPCLLTRSFVLPTTTTYRKSLDGILWHTPTRAGDQQSIRELQKLSVEFKEIILTRSPYQMAQQSVEYGLCTEKMKSSRLAF